MNDLFAADPKIGRDSLALRFLFSLFGHSSGRYLMDFPATWRADVLKAREGLGDIEEARLRTLLRRAKEQGVFRSAPGLVWEQEFDWLANIMTQLKLGRAVVAGLILDAADSPASDFVVPTWPLTEVPLPPTAEERIAGAATEYCRVSTTLLVGSAELAFVDPYLDFRKRAVTRVLEPMLDKVRRSACQRVLLHVRAVSVNDMDECVAQAQQQLGRIMDLYMPTRPQKINMLWWDDDRASERMHGRYLLSNKGGIRFDQGFQVLPAGRMVDVAPVSPSVHLKLYEHFFDNKHDMKLVASISLEK
ncbi:hypothetical protein NX784_27465 [Massilia pinisoli]|uniref:Uncharacterized protein n=1 Tax=Massilia pinisoli TaxID=1772194 RepID=A0ABT1ZZG7_9BURK|nr:hypothetical protein [Massilia pinisoli]MCS0585324.1 hypothetical protein [Massilia pinisoli]